MKGRNEKTESSRSRLGYNRSVLRLISIDGGNCYRKNRNITGYTALAYNVLSSSRYFLGLRGQEKVDLGGRVKYLGPIGMETAAVVLVLIVALVVVATSGDGDSTSRTINGRPRVVVEEGRRFEKGDAVLGGAISLANGERYFRCFLLVAPEAGIVVRLPDEGPSIINPRVDKISRALVCELPEEVEKKQE